MHKANASRYGLAASVLPLRDLGPRHADEAAAIPSGTDLAQLPRPAFR